MQKESNGRQGDKIILQIVPVSAEKVLENFEGETVMNWKNLSLKRLEDQDVCIWQLIDIMGPQKEKRREREIDPALFLPQIDAIIIFYEIKDKTSIVEWLRAIVNDVRLKNITPIIVGCYQKGENTNKFKEMFMNADDDDESKFYLWRTDSQEEIVEIYQKILELL